MPAIQPCELPPGALLRTYSERGAYTDCYATQLARPVSHAAYVEAFYTTPVFKLERLLLTWFAASPSSDAQARELALGMRDAFAAWTVEARAADQLLLCDAAGRTRSWLMVAPVEPGTPRGGTWLYFGSAVVPVVDGKTGQPTLGATFRALLGFHKLYSRILLRAAIARLRTGIGTEA